MLETLEDRRLLTTLVAGQTATTSITSPTQLKNYTIYLSAGQFVAVSASDRNLTAFTPKLQLIGPNHKTVRTAIGDDGAFLGTTAPASGTYIVRLTDETRTHTGGSSITAFYGGKKTVKDSDDAGSVDGLSGRRFAATIGPGDLDVWRIDATKGQFLSVEAAENAANSAVNLGVAVVGPDGAGIASKESDTSLNIDVQSVPRAGTYYFVVYEAGQNATGRYGISFAQTPGTQTSEDPDTQAPLVSGQTRTGDLPSGDYDIYQTTLAAGRSVTVTVARGSSGTTMPDIVLVDPAGDIVDQATGTTTATLTYTTTTAGSYAIVLRNGSGDSGGAYTFKYTLA